MCPSDQDSLLRSAKGIDCAAFAIQPTPNKIMFIPKGNKGFHYTVHIGVRPGILDLHETWYDPDGSKHHKTLFAMRQCDLERLLTSISHSTGKELRVIFRKLRVGWMYRHNIGVTFGVIPTDQQLSTIAKLGKRKRLRFDEERLLSNIRAPEFLEDIFDEPDGMFSLVSLKRGKSKEIGFGYKVTGPTGAARLFWIKKEGLHILMSHIGDMIFQTASRFAIPPEDYSKHGL